MPPRSRRRRSSSTGAHWSSDELAAIAAGWLDFVHAVGPAHGRADRPAAEQSSADASRSSSRCRACPLPVVVLPRGPARLAELAAAAAGHAGLRRAVAPRARAGARRPLGLRTVVVPDARPAAAPPGSVSFLTCPGFVNFTSGSTGPAQARVHHDAELPPADGGHRRGERARPRRRRRGLAPALDALRPRPGADPADACSARRSGCVERFDHRSLLRLLARGAVRVLGRHAADGRHAGPRAAVRARARPRPPICHISAGPALARASSAPSASASA